MNQRRKQIRLKLFIVICIDSFLFLLLLAAVYTFFIVPVRAESSVLQPDIFEVNNSCVAGSIISCTVSPSPTNTADPSPTFTPEPTSTNTLEPSPTCTPDPSPTYTPDPSPTYTPDPSPTYTPDPSPTYTPDPSPTNTLEPTTTNTSTPNPTDTLEPSPTSTFEPSATSTIKPSASPTLMPTSTQTTTLEPSWTPIPTTVEPEYTDTPAPSPTERQVLSTPTATPTSTESLCPECYLIKDFRELIISGFYSADLLNTEPISSTVNVSITLYNEYKGVVIGKPIEMVDFQPAGDVLHVQTRLWCLRPKLGDEHWVHTIATAQNSTGKIWFAVDEWVRLNISMKK